MTPGTPRDERDKFEMLYACALSGQLSAAQWHQHLTDTPGLAEWVDEQERLMQRSGYAR